MKSTAKAPANIAFIKYWGKENTDLRIPLNSSFSMNLSHAYTLTTVEFSPRLQKDDISIIGSSFSDKEKQKISQHLNRIRQKSDVGSYARVVTQNSFPKGTGIASSASGFAALTVAGFASVGMTLSEKELTIFARLASGSAARSICDGFVIWEKGTDSASSYAHSLYRHDYWDIRDCVCVVDNKMKKTESTQGMQGITTSPFWQERVQGIDQKLTVLKDAFTQKNFHQLGAILEADALNMHAVMLTQDPACFYWQPKTIELLKNVVEWREKGFPVYATTDAGPTVHILYEGKDEKELLTRIKTISGVQSILLNKGAPGTQLVEKHLF